MARRRATLEARSLIREAQAIVGGAIALFLALALLSYSPEMPHHNLGGRIGNAIADAALQAIGVAAYLFPIYLAMLMASLFRDGTEDLGTLRVAGAVLLVASVAALAGLLSGGGHAAHGGGWLGGFLGTALGELLGGIGAFLVLVMLAVVALVLSTGVSAFEAADRAWRWGRQAFAAAVDAWRDRRSATERPAARTLARRREAPVRLLLDQVVEPIAARDVSPPPIIREPEKPEKKAPVARRERGKRLEGQEELFANDRYRLPTVSLLDEPKRREEPLDEAALHASSRILETKLGDFGVAGRVVAVRPGPVITTFEFEPAPGVKVSRIVGLADDLAMALRAASVRILAPIPGKPVVGIEVSNPRRETVYIREMIEAEAYRGAESHLALVLGKDTTGNAVASDLGRMPHLLIAGATGTGKSVSMNAMILSILFKSSPRDVRMIMIDPKMLELSSYENVPHLLVPVVTDPRKAAAALNNMLREMDERYQLLHAKGVRNVDSYNRAIAQMAPPGPVEDDPDEAADEEEIDVVPAPPPRAGLNHRHLPRIVVIIDELADLMMTVGREIEESITRLAQKARAAGIHLILATQRPSVDVITGLIKANFPARLSFQVTSRTDSRTILDAIGAERLLGQGDMLFLPPGTARVVRLHGPFVSDEEVHRVVDFIKRQEQPQYDMALLEDETADEDAPEDEEDLSDEMYDMAVRLVTEHRQASISWLQRRLRVGYNRAARMIERMERDGVVSAPLGARGREVLAPSLEE